MTASGNWKLVVYYSEDMPEDELIRNIQQGKIDLFNQIVESYFDKIFRYTLKMHMGNIHDAEDSTAETFFKAYRYINSYSTAISFSAWLYRIAKNTAIDVLRKHKRQPSVSLESYVQDHGEPHAVMGDKSSPDEKMLIDALLQYVDEEERSLLTLYYLEDVPIREISDLYKIKENTITVKIKRAKEKIRSIAKEKGITYDEH